MYLACDTELQFKKIQTQHLYILVKKNIQFEKCVTIILSGTLSLGPILLIPVQK